MRKALQVPKRQYRRVFAPDLSDGMNSATDSRILPPRQGEAAYNVSVESGAVRRGYGVVATTVPSAYTRVFYYKRYDEESGTACGCYLLYEEESGKIYASALGAADATEVAGISFAAPPLGVNYRLNGEDVFLLCGQEGMAVVYPTLTAAVVPSAPAVTSLSMHNERMFVTIGGRRNAVWFSDDLDPTNWNPELDEGGFIELEGEGGRLNRAVAFGGYVYLFRDYGIARLTAYGAQSEFAVTQLFVSSGRIYADTVAVCGDRILFLAEGGLYSFDGLTTSRVCTRLDGLLLPGEPCACYFAGRYYLAATLRDEAPALLTVDPRKGTACIGRGIAVAAFSPIAAEEERLWVYAPGEAFLGEVCRGGATFFSEPLSAMWRSGMTDLGTPERRKLVTDVYLDTEYDCTLCVRTEKREKTFAIRGGKAVQRRRVNLAGTKVQLEITASGNVNFARPSLRFVALGNV